MTTPDKNVNPCKELYDTLIRENALYSLAADFYINVQYLTKVKCMGMFVTQYKTVTDHRENKIKIH